MKNMKSFLGLLALLPAIIALALTACPNASDPDPEPAPTVTSVSVSPKTPGVEAGEALTFTATVSGTGNFTQTVTWTVSRSGGGVVKTGTAFTGAQLAVAGDEPTGTLTVTATSTVDTTKSDTATVTVYAAGSKPTVTTVAVSPASPSVAKGGTQAFIATVSGTNDPAQTVTWSVSGGNADTAISEVGLLSVAANESAASLTVKAISTVDTAKFGTATVTVTGDDGPVDNPNSDTLARLAAHLASLAANTAETPHTVALDSTVTIDTSETSESDVWATINSTVQAAEKYVILDLSACSATDNRIEGNMNPTNNDFNIIKSNSYITGVVLPSTLTAIWAYAFSGCTGLTSVTIPEGVTLIGNYAFQSCTGLASVTIPSSVTLIGDLAFNSCIGLTEFIVIESNTAYSVQDGILYNSDKTTIVSVIMPKSGSLTLLDSLTSIGDYALYSCTNLTSVTIPEGVISIGDYAFSRCTGLASMIIPEGVTSIGQQAFSGCTSLTSVTIPEGVTSIAASAFQNCSGLTSVTIPGSVTSIGSQAFLYCSLLTSITFGTGSNITTAWSDNTFSAGNSVAPIFTGTRLWNLYSIRKAGTYVYDNSWM
jgi:hypothetical protein